MQKACCRRLTMDQRYATGKKPTPSSHGERARYLNHELDGPSRFGNYRTELLQKLDELKDHLSRSCEFAEPRIGTNMRISPVLNQAYSRNHAGFVQERMSRSYGGYRSSGLRDLHFHQGYRHEFQSCPDFEQPRSRYLHQPYHDLFVPNRDFHKNTCSCVHCIDQDLDLHVIAPFPHNRRSRGLTTELKFGNGGIHQNCSSKTEEARRRGRTMLPFAGGAPFIACSSCFELLKLPRKHISLAKRQQKLKCGACSSIIPFELERKASTVPVSGNSDHVVVTEMDDFRGVVVDKNSSSNAIDPNPCSSYSNADSPPQNLPLSDTLSSEKNGSSSAEVESFSHPTLSTENSTNVVVEQRDRGAKDTKSELNNNVPWQNSVKDSAVSTEIDMPSKEYSKSSVTMDSIDTIKEQRVRDEKGADHSTNVVVEQRDIGAKDTKYQLNKNVSWQDSVKDSAVSTEIEMPSKEFSKSSVTMDSIDTIKERRVRDEKGADHSTNVVVEQRDSGAKDTKSELNNNVSWQDSVKDSAVSTEIDMPSKEFSKSSVTMDSIDTIKERRVRDEKGAESSSEGHAAGFVVMAENVEVGSSQVFVNRHLIPEHLVQKAELLAGPIQPGDYWYDIRAGFWGVMGFPCLGIIMPNIQEFNYPMPVNCSAGNTEIFVNGRELHRKDLDLLVGRGLPKTRQRSYLITLSGEVIDEETGQELDSIGRLAPSVERAKRGFGLKVPSFIARLQR